MKNSSTPANEEENGKPEVILEFPDGSDFISKPPRLDWILMFRRSEELIRSVQDWSKIDENRLRHKVPVEFVL